MIAFAANSILCRLALQNPANDPLSFALVRLGSGGLALSLFFFVLKPKGVKQFTTTNLWPPLMLFLYALFFSLSYVSLGAGTGALVLFASVQLSMVTASFLKGDRLSVRDCIGFTLGLMGLLYLLLPGLHTPPPIPLGLMALSGISWGIYSLLGQNASSPVFSTSRNFLFNLPVVILLAAFIPIRLNEGGWIWAMLSGGITSALGYIVWYLALRNLSTFAASIVQLSVPAIAAFGGVLFLNETLQARLITASMLIFTGILIKAYPLRGTSTG